MIDSVAQWFFFAFIAKYFAINKNNLFIFGKSLNNACDEQAKYLAINAKKPLSSESIIPIISTSSSTIVDYYVPYENKLLLHEFECVSPGVELHTVMYFDSMYTERSKYYETLSEDMKLRYDAKIELSGGIDPYTLTKKGLSVQKDDFPEISLLDIGNYMIHSVSAFSKKAFKAYKSMESYSFFESGFVLYIGSKKIGDISILFGKVGHSMRMNEPPHKVWILAKTDGEILSAHCTCIAGLSESCSHVGAVCFAVMNIMESNETMSVTDLLCKWNVPKFSKVSMSSVKDIKWTSSNYEELTTSAQEPETSSFRSYIDSLTPFSDESIEGFIKTIHLDGQESAIRDSLYPNEIRRKSKINDNVFLAHLYNKVNFGKSRDELIEMAKSKPLKITPLDLEEISRLTLPKGDLSSSVALKRGRVTGSNLKDCCRTNIKTPSITIINRLISPIQHLEHVPNIKYEMKNKKKAKGVYLKVSSTYHEDFKYNECGLVIHPKTPYFASSCDGYISCSCHGSGCVVIKCPKILENTESFNVLTCKPNNILNQFDGEFSLEQDHQLFYKAQMLIHLAEVNYCDIVIWSPSQTLTLHINADTEFWRKVSEKAATFHQQVMMPELLGKFFTGRLDNGPTTDDVRDNKSTVIGLEIEVLGSEDD